jgi:hypothetical protein
MYNVASLQKNTIEVRTKNSAMVEFFCCVHIRIQFTDDRATVTRCTSLRVRFETHIPTLGSAEAAIQYGFCHRKIRHIYRVFVSGPTAMPLKAGHRRNCYRTALYGRRPSLD